MGIKHHRVLALGSLLALSTILLIITLAVQASASHSADEGNTFVARLPPEGSLYTINVVGRAHISGEDIFKPVSAEMEFEVVSIKSTGIPQINLALTSGKFSLGDDLYVLTKGSTTIPANKVNIEASTADGMNILTVFATLAAPLPLSASQDPAGLVPAIHDKSADIRVGAEDWILDFSGTLSYGQVVVEEPESELEPPRKISERASLYTINVVGRAHISGEDIFKPVSAEMEFEVVSIKSTGIPQINLALTSGKFSLGDDLYVLTKGSTTIPANKVNIEASTEDRTNILTVFATLGGPLPISTTEDPVGLFPAIHDKSADIRVGAEDWILDFSGTLSYGPEPKLQPPTPISERISLSNLQMVDEVGSHIFDVSPGEQVVLQSSVKNNLSIDQKFTYIMQIKDSDGITIRIAWINGEIPANKTFDVGLSWIADEGVYNVEVFVWESVTNPLPLSLKTLSMTIGGHGDGHGLH